MRVFGHGYARGVYPLRSPVGSGPGGGTTAKLDVVHTKRPVVHKKPPSGGFSAGGTMQQLTFEPHPAQAEVLLDKAKTKVLCAGRRFGKDILSLNLLLKTCLELAQQREPSQYLNPHVHAWVVGPSYGIITQAWRDLRGLVPPGWIKIHPHTRRPMIHDTPPYSMVLGVAGPGREILIEFKSADRPDDLVGSGLDFLLMTEAARVAEEAWQVVRPTLNSPGRAGFAILNSTPKGRNWFYDLWRQGQPDYEGYDPKRLRSWRFSTFENPHLTPDQLADIEADRKRMGERWFRQEYLAEFIDSLGKAIPSAAIERCAVGEIKDPEPDKHYTAGLDFGRYENPTVLIIGDPIEREVVYYDRFSGASVDYACNRVASALRRFNNAKVYLDRTGIGEALLEALRRERVNHEPVHFNSQTKPQMFEWMISLIEQGAIRFPPIPQLITELEELEYEMTPTGYTRYRKPRRGHDDSVDALALWCHSFARKKRPSIRWL